MHKLSVGTGILLVVLALILLLRPSVEPGEHDPAGLRANSRDFKGAQGPGTLPSKSSRSDRVHAPSPFTYSGPRGITGWFPVPPAVTATETVSKPAWEFVDGKLVSSRGGAIAREIRSPSRSKLSFTLEWRNSVRFRFLWGADNGESTQPDNCYDFVIQRRFVYLRKRWMVKESGGSRIIGQANLPALAERSEARFEFYLDRDLGLISLYLNGEDAHQFVDTDPTVGAFGDWLQFVAEDFYPVQISDLILEAWNGILPDGETVESLAANREARAQWIESLKPVAPWPPQVKYEQTTQRVLAQYEQQLRDENSEGAEAPHELRQALAEAKRRLNQAIAELPLAEPDPERKGHVINPFTGQPLDVRGAWGRIRDPNDPNPDHTFRIR